MSLRGEPGSECSSNWIVMADSGESCTITWAPGRGLSACFLWHGHAVHHSQVNVIPATTHLDRMSRKRGVDHGTSILLWPVHFWRADSLVSFGCCRDYVVSLARKCCCKWARAQFRAGICLDPWMQCHVNRWPVVHNAAVVPGKADVAHFA